MEMKTNARVVLRALDGDPLVELKALLLDGLGYAAIESSLQCRTVPLAFCEASDSEGAIIIRDSCLSLKSRGGGIKGRMLSLQ